MSRTWRSMELALFLRAWRCAEGDNPNNIITAVLKSNGYTRTLAQIEQKKQEFTRSYALIRSHISTLDAILDNEHSKDDKDGGTDADVTPNGRHSKKQRRRFKRETYLESFSKKNKSRIVYPDCSLALKPVAHAAKNIPIPELPSSFDKDSLSEESTASTSTEGIPSDTAVYCDGPGSSEKVPRLLSQLELNDLDFTQFYLPVLIHWVTFNPAEVVQVTNLFIFTLSITLHDLCQGNNSILKNLNYMFDRNMLDNSLQELITTVKELEQRSETIQDEGNEWRTRFETQEEINKQLQQQDLVLTKKVDEARRNLKEATKKPKDNNSTQDNTEITPQYVKILEKEKNSLANQLRDLEWRLDQESKAYHKANDERKQYILEINITKSTLEDLKMKQRYNNITSHYAHNCVMAAQMNQQNDQFHNPRQQRDGDGNIRENHRVLDPRKGPMKKTVGIRTLPSLDQDGD
ncbi:uncharacterized protein LOC106870161 [Octopus bimaculoides]|nr:uncharacterized protein LOC106870161 [Octopus bimaculoides]